MAKLYPISPPSLFPPQITPPKITPPKITPPKLTAYNSAIPGSNYYNWYAAKINQEADKARIKDIGDIIFGHPIYGTRQLQETLEKNNLKQLIGMPIVNRLAGTGLWVKDSILKPYGDIFTTKFKDGYQFGDVLSSLTAGTLKSGINSLEALGNSIDTLTFANPMKAILGAGDGDPGEDFLRSMGWLEGEYREIYNWDVDIDNPWVKYPVDILLEIISDPTSWISLGAGGAVKQSEKGLVKATKTALQGPYDDIAVQLRHLHNEGVIEDITKYGFNNYDELVEFVLKHIEDNPNEIVRELNKQLDGVVDELHKELKKARSYGNTEKVDKLLKLTATLENNPLMTKAQVDRFKRAIQSIAQSTDYAKYKGAVAFKDRFSDIEANMNKVSFGFAAPQALLFKTAATPLEKRIKRKITNAYFNLDNYSMEQLREKLKITPPTKIEDTINEYLDSYNALVKARNKEYGQLSQGLNTDALVRRLRNLALYAPAECKENAKTLKNYLKRKAFEIITKESEFYKNMNMQNQKYKEFLIKLNKTKEFRAEVAKSIKLQKQFESLYETNKAMSSLDRAVEEVVGKVMSVAAISEDIKFKELQKVYKDYQKAEPAAIYKDIEEALNQYVQAYSIFIGDPKADIDAFISAIKNSDIIDKSDLKVLGDMRLRGLSQDNLRQIYNKVQRIKEIQNDLSAIDRPIFHEPKHIIRSTIIPGSDEYELFKEYLRDMNDIKTIQKDIKKIILDELELYSRNNFNWFPKQYSDLAQAEYNKGLKKGLEYYSSFKKGITSKHLEIKNVVKQTQGDEYLKAIEKGSAEVQAIAKEQKHKLKTELYDLLDNLNADGKDVYYFLSAYFGDETKIPDYINDIFRMNATKSRKPYISEELIDELISDRDNFSTFMYYFKEMLSKLDENKALANNAVAITTREEAIKNLVEIKIPVYEEQLYDAINSGASTKVIAKLNEILYQAKDTVIRNENELKSLTASSAQLTTLQQVYDAFNNIEDIMDGQGIYVKNTSDEILNILSKRTDETIKALTKSLGTTNLQVPQLNMFSKLIRVSIDFCDKVETMFPNIGAPNSESRRIIKSAIETAKQYDADLGSQLEQAVLNLERQYDQARAVIRNVFSIDFNTTFKLSEEEERSIVVQIVDTLQGLDKRPDKIITNARDLTDIILDELNLNILRLADKEQKGYAKFTQDQFEFFKLRKKVQALNAEGYIEKENGTLEGIIPYTVHELIMDENWDTLKTMYHATDEDIVDFKKYKELYDSNIWDSLKVAFNDSDEKKEFYNLLDKVKNSKDLNSEEYEKFEYLVSKGYLPDELGPNKELLAIAEATIRPELYDIIYPYMRNYLEEMKRLYHIYGNSVKLYDMPNSETLSLLSKYSSTLTKMVNDIVDTGVTNAVDLETLLGTISELSKFAPVYINKEQLRKNLGLLDVKGVTETSRKAYLNRMQQKITGLNTHDFGTLSGELKRNYRDLTIEANQYRNFTTAGAPDDILKKVEELRELETKRLEGLLTNEEMHTYYQLEREIEPWFLPTTLYTPEEVKRLTGMNAWELARESGVAVSNYIDAKIIKELGLTSHYINSSALSDYQKLITFNNLQSKLKKIRALDDLSIVKRNINEWSELLFDYYIEHLNEVGGLLLGMEVWDKQSLYNLDGQIKRAYMWAIRELEPEHYQAVVSATKAKQNALNKSKYANSLDTFQTLDDEINKQADYITFLDASNKEQAIGKVMEDGVIDPLLDAVTSEQWSDNLAVIGTGAKGINKTYVIKQKKMVDELRDIMRESVSALDDTSKKTSEIKLANELTYHMIDPLTTKLSEATKRDPMNLVNYIANTNYTHGFVFVDAKAFNDISDKLLKKVDLVKVPFISSDGRLKAYLIYSTKELPKPNPEWFNTFITKEIGTKPLFGMKYISDPLDKIHEMQDEFADFLSLTSYKIDKKKHTKDVVTDLTPLKYYNRGHKLNYRAMDAVLQTKMFNAKGFYADKIKNATESEFLNLADFVFLTDAYTYNDMLAHLLDIGLDYSELEGMYRAQSLLHSLNKGISNGINNVANNYKGVRLFFDKDTVLADNTNRFMKHIYNNKAAFFKDNSKYLETTPIIGQKGLVPIILKQDKYGNPVIHRVVISNNEDLMRFKRAEHLIVDYETYSFLLNNINVVGATGARKILYTVLKPIYATAYLTSTGFLLRNALDTLGIKNMETTDGLQGLPTLLTKEYSAFKEINTYKRCMKELNTYALEHGLKHGPNKYTYAAVSKHWDKETLDTFKLITIWSQTTAAGSLASDVRSAFKTKDFDTVFEECLSMALDNPISHSVMSANEMIEQVGRLGLMHYLVDEKNLELPEAVKEVVKTHFNYQIKDMGMEYLRDFFMFETFPINNTLYYLDIGLNRNPDVLKLLLDMEEESWNNGDISWDDVRNNPYLAQQVLMGNMKVGDYILKTGSSLMDFFNIIGAPLNAIFERSNPLIRAGLNLDLNQANPFMAYPSRFRQIKKFIDTQGEEGSIVPSVYSKLSKATKEFKRNKKRYTTNYPKWTKYPKIRKPHKTYIRNYRFYTKPYYFKRPNTLAWATADSKWNIRPTYKLPRGARYYTRRYIGTPEYLTKFGPEDI